MVAPLAVNVSELPEQILAEEAEMFKVGVAFTVTEIVVVLLQLDALVPVTVYVVVTVGLTAITVVVADVFQRYEEAPLAVKFTELPTQMLEEGAEIETVGLAFTATVNVLVIVHPAPLEPFTV